jgi:hypothetical protein
MITDLGTSFDYLVSVVEGMNKLSACRGRHISEVRCPRMPMSRLRWRICMNTWVSSSHTRARTMSCRRGAWVTKTKLVCTGDQ